MTRINFSTATKKIAADRAGHQCSFPTCQRRTIGPGHMDNTVSGSGIAAHIYSAAPSGPRGQGGLTKGELEQPENCIWLCSDHAKLVDNNRGIAFPPETLLSYKALQEARMMREVQGLYSPIGWIHEMEFGKNPLFERGQKVRFAKLNLLFGENMSGKTALTEWIAGAFDFSYLNHWRRPKSSKLQFRLSYLNPEPVSVEVETSGDNPIKYRLNSTTVPFNPIGLRILRLTSLQFREGADDLTLLAEALGLPTHVVHNLVNEVHSFPNAKVRNLRFVDEDGGVMLYADVDGTVPKLPLRLLSGRETERVFIEFATAAARVAGKYIPTLLILDGCPSILFEDIFDFYSHHLLDPENQFQTIMCIPSRDMNLDVLRWKGWEVIRTAGHQPSIRLTQELRSG